MKKLSNDANSDIIINNKDEYSIFPSFISINKKYNKFSNNNNRNNNSNNNYNFNTEIWPKKNKKMKRIKNEGKYSQKTYDIENSLSNIKKQLNNVSINEKHILKIHTNKASNSNSLNKLYHFSTKKANTLSNLLNNNKFEIEKRNLILEINHISFSILKSTSGKYDLFLKNKELQNENNLLKENVKFLLSQIKKYKKIESKKKLNEMPKTNEDINIKNNYKKLEKNKINNVFDIINKYKKEIMALKSKLKNITKQNEELKEYISNNEKAVNLSFNNMKHFFKKDSILKKPKIKNNTLFNHKFYYNQKNNNNKDNIPLYKKKTFNKTFSSFKRNPYNTYDGENTNGERFIQTFNNTKNNLFDTNEVKNFNYTEKNYKNNNNIIDKFNSKIKHLIIIDSEFTGEEKIENQINTFKKNRKINYRNFNNKYNNENAHSTSINNDLYYKKTIDSSKLKKIYFDETFKRQTLFKEYNTLNSENI